MAKFKDMHSFTQFVARENQKRDEKYAGFERDDPTVVDLRLLGEEEALLVYSKLNGLPLEGVSKICEDAQDYQFIKGVTPENPYTQEHHGRLLRVSTQGRHLLESLGRLKKWGLFRAWAKDNKELNSFILTFLGGIVIGIAGVIVAIIGLSND